VQSMVKSRRSIISIKLSVSSIDRMVFEVLSCDSVGRIAECPIAIF
jgi:hypothetical protein